MKRKSLSLAAVMVAAALFLVPAPETDAAAGDSGSVKNEGPSTVRVRVDRSNQIDFQYLTLPPGVSVDLPRLAHQVVVFPDPLDPAAADSEVSVRLRHPGGTDDVIRAYKKKQRVHYRAELESRESDERA